jgi:DNA repair exonuclease SbcCD ATPase subunit
MKIHSISFKNFYSYYEADLDLSKYTSGLVGIEGINKDSGGSNGAGKSVILEAIVFALFGRTIRKSNEVAMVNVQAKRGMEVTIKVEDMVITRKRKPSSLNLWINGEEVTQAHAATSQAFIERHLGVNYKTFMSAAVFGQHSTVDFLDANPDDKRKIINSFLNLSYIFDKKAEIKERRSALRATIRDNEVLISKLRSDIAKYEGMTGQNLTDEQAAIVRDYTLEQIIDMRSNNWSVERNISGYSDTVRTPPSDVRNARKAVKSGVGSDQSWTCKSCNTKFDGKLTQEQYDHCKGIVEKWDTKVKEHKQVIKELKRDMKRLPCTVSEYQKWSSLSPVDGILADSRRELEQVLELNFNMQDKYDMLGFWDKAFSEKGLVRYVIRTVRDYLNDKCNFYLAYLTQGQITLTFDDELLENIEVGGKLRHYISLSGGEKRKVNLAVMLALQSILSVSNGTESNVLFFDEVAENLDEHGIKGLIDLLYELRKDKTVFVITHNPHLASHMESHKKITITKEQGVSTLS